MNNSAALDPDTMVPLVEQFTGPTGHALLPGGYGRNLMAVAPWAPMVTYGQGCWITDEDGRKLFDLNNNFTTHVLGNAHPSVVSAVVEAVGKGVSFGMSNPYEIEHGRKLLDRFGAMDQIRYVNSGTEATMLAARVARARTGKDRVVVVSGSYHGWNDAVLPTGGARSQRGVPRSTLADTLVVPFDDTARLKEVVTANSGEIAAIFLDLLPNRIGMLPPSDDFIDLAATLAQKEGAALVVDEVISFRLHRGGLTTARRLPADMVAMGKMIGGGLPAGALVGKAAWMAELDVRSANGLEGGGTMSGNPLTMAAGIAVLDHFNDDQIFRLAKLGDRFRGGLRETFAAHGWEPRGQGSLTRLFPLGITEPAAIVETQRRLWWAAYQRGVLVAKHGVAALSTPMDESTVDDAVLALQDAVGAVAKVQS